MARIQHVTVAAPAEDLLPAVRAFYELLGGVALVRPPMLVEDTPGCWMGFGETQVHVIVGRSDPGPAHFALDLGGEFDRVLQDLEAKGVARRDARALWGARRCFVRDPADNLVELFGQAPQSIPE